LSACCYCLSLSQDLHGGRPSKIHGFSTTVKLMSGFSSLPRIPLQTAAPLETARQP